MNCIYTVFYKNLKSYDGSEVHLNTRLELLELCKYSFQRFNPNIPFILDIVTEEVNNTAEMYFDKMHRIKELNYNYNVLWVDADTICLDDISNLFISDTMCGAFWGGWDALNVINGGVVYYPKRFLYDNYNKFSKSWISLLMSLNEEGRKFIGPHEQFPITDLLLSQINGDSKNYSIIDNEILLGQKRLLIDRIYNTNPFNKHYSDHNVLNDCNSICGKKILHLNTSIGNDITIQIARFICNSLLGYTNVPILLKERCDELHVSNEFLNIVNDNDKFSIINTQYAFISVYVMDTPLRTIKKSVSYQLTPGTRCDIDTKDVYEIIIKNILSGEVKIINLNNGQTTSNEDSHKEGA